MNTVPILQQQRSDITTNPFISNEQQQLELVTIEQNANKIIEDQYARNRVTSIKNKSLQELNENISNSVIGIIDDLFKKPSDLPWNLYIVEIFTKEQRYAYIGMLLIIISLIIYIFSK